MASCAPARKVALTVVSRARRRDAYARELLRVAPEMTRLSLKSRGLASRLVLGTCACVGQLDDVLDRYVAKPKGLQPRVRDALRLACFELLHLDTATQVAVSQGVELVRDVAPRAAGLANAVLRRVAAEERPRVRAAKDAVEACVADGGVIGDELLAAASGMPEWLTATIKASWGDVKAAQVALSQLEPAPVWVATNTGVTTSEAAFAKLQEVQTAPVPIALPGSFLLEKPAALNGSGLIGSVDVVVSDLGSQMVSRIGAPQPGSSLLEVGQGRATKTLLLENAAASLGGAASIVAVDVSEFKVRLATERVSHGWEASVLSLAYDATKLADSALPPELDRTFDTVFCDVPCSGTGTMRRHPEIPWTLKQENLEPTGLPQLQWSILCAAAHRVKAGGTLIYATCSICTQEDQAVLDAFLTTPLGSQFEVANVCDAPGVAAAPEPFQELVASHTTPEGYFCSLPALLGPDGHFAARLIRRS